MPTGTGSYVPIHVVKRWFPGPWESNFLFNVRWEDYIYFNKTGNEFLFANFLKKMLWRKGDQESIIPTISVWSFAQLRKALMRNRLNLLKNKECWKNFKVFKVYNNSQQKNIVWNQTEWNKMLPWKVSGRNVGYQLVWCFFLYMVKLSFKVKIMNRSHNCSNS